MGRRLPCCLYVCVCVCLCVCLCMCVCVAGAVSHSNQRDAGTAEPGEAVDNIQGLPEPMSGDGRGEERVCKRAAAGTAVCVCVCVCVGVCVCVCVCES